MYYEGKVNDSLMHGPKVIVSTQCPFSLLSKGHYTVHVIYRDSEKWILCNHKAVFVLDEPKTKKKPIDPQTPYAFVYSWLYFTSILLT